MNKKDILDLVMTNIIIHQSDGFQLGYAQAISDLIEDMIDYTKCSDDELTKDFLNTLVDMGEELNKRKKIAEDNLNKAKDMGYTERINWHNKVTFASCIIHVKNLDLLEEDAEGEQT